MAIRKKSLMMVVGLLCAGSSMQGMWHGANRPLDARDSDGNLFPLTKLSDDKTRYIPVERDGQGGYREISGLEFDGATQRWITAAPAIVVTPGPEAQPLNAEEIAAGFYYNKEGELCVVAHAGSTEEPEDEQPEIEQPEITPEPTALSHSGSDMNLAGITGSTKHQPHVGPQPEEPAVQQEQHEQQQKTPVLSSFLAPEQGEGEKSATASAASSAPSSPSTSRRESVDSSVSSVKSVKAEVEKLIDGAQQQDAEGSVSGNESGSEADSEGRQSPVRRGGGKLPGAAKRAKRGSSEDEATELFRTGGDKKLNDPEDEGEAGMQGQAGSSAAQPQDEQGASAQNNENNDGKDKENLDKTENTPKCCWSKVKTPVAFCAVALVTYCGYRLHQWWKGNAASSDVSEDDSLDKNGGSEL